MLANKLLAAAGGGVETLFSDDVFAAHTYVGNGGTQTITNGIDLAGKSGMVWTKARSTTTHNTLLDTARGVTSALVSNLSSGTTTLSNSLTSYNATGYTLGADSSGYTNTNTTTYVSHTFRKAPKFFDVVTWTGNATNRTISHALGQEVGLILVKRTDTAADWQVYHRSLANTEYMVLNSTAAKATGATRWNSTTPTTSVFSLGTDATVNASGGTYVAYLFAHDASADGIVQCGSFTTDGSGNATVSLGWEPQYLMVKSSASVNGWWTFDTARGMPAAPATTPLVLQAQSTAAETPFGAQMAPNATGFAATALGATVTYIYLAIRRPNKPPTVGTQVYNAIARTGTGAAATVTGVGFAPDLLLTGKRTGAAWGAAHDRLRGVGLLLGPWSTSGETTNSVSVTSFTPDGVGVGADGTGFQSVNGSGMTYANWFFKRAPGVFDQVCYTGTGVAKTEAHNLGVVPELIITKSRISAINYNWEVGYIDSPSTGRLRLNTTGIGYDITAFWSAFTSTGFTLATANDVNFNGSTYVAYLFATKSGISKVGNYTGNGGTAGSAGSSQTINCGFTTGSRFVMLKCTSHTSDWVVVDTVRGLIAGSDPALSLNTTAAEVTATDLLDADTSGFVVNQLATGTTSADFNVTGRTYIYLSFS